jgi:serine protease Do
MLCCYILLFSLWYSSPAAVAGDDLATLRHPLPISELEAVLFEALSQSGFSLKRSALEMGRVELYAVKPGASWRLILKPHSALATEMWIEPADNPASRRALLEELSNYVSNYLANPSVDKGSNSYNIPPAVLSQIDAVVCIRANDNEKDIQVSGFIFDSQGLILCTTHDLQNLREIDIAFYDGGRIKGKLVKIDVHKDLALVRINSPVQSFISLTDGRNQVSPGESVFSVGCPANLIGTVHTGTISGPPRRAGQSLYWQVNMNIYPGSSGSPVFDERGKLIGIIKGHRRGANNIGFLIPFETIVAFMQAQ